MSLASLFRSDLPASILVGALARLLERNAWACERLQPFAGRHACLRLGGLTLAFGITPAGSVSALRKSETPSVRLEIPASALAALPDGPDAVFRQAQIVGEAHFAETLGFVLRNLQWDIEEDLSRVVGDPLAHRLHSTARGLAQQGREAGRNLAANLQEYLLEEARLTPRRDELDAFGKDLAAMQERLAEALKRTERLARS